MCLLERMPVLPFKPLAALRYQVFENQHCGTVQRRCYTTSWLCLPNSLEVAIQTGEKILRLVAFIESVKEAPLEVKYLLDEMNVLHRLLAQFGSSCIKDLDGKKSGVVSEVDQLCLHSTETLDKVVEEMNIHILKNRVLDSLKAIAKKDNIERLRDRVRDARAMFHLSRQLYSESLQRQNNQQLAQLLVQQLESQLRPEAIAQQTLLLTNSSVSTSSVENSNSPDGAGLTALFPVPSSFSLAKRKQGGSKSSIRVRDPRWFKFKRIIFEINCYRSISALDVGFRVYHEVPEHAPVMVYAMIGCVEGIRELFDIGWASPFDKNPFGESIFSVAARCRQIEVCRMLLGLDLSSEIDRTGRLETFSYLIGLGYTEAKDLPLLEFLAQNDELADPLQCDAHGWGCVYVRADARGLAWIIQKSRSNFFQLNIEERICIILGLAGVKAQPDLPSVVRFLLGADTVSPALCRATVNRKQILLHCVASNLGEQYNCSPATYKAHVSGTEAMDSAKQYQLKELCLLLRDITHDGAELHEIGTAYGSPQTPLGMIFEGFQDANRTECHCSRRDDVFHRVHGVPGTVTITQVIVPIIIWLEELWKAGIDLVKYGEKEKKIWLSSLVCDIFSYTTWDSGSTRTGYSMLFTYGPAPNDWHFLFTEQMDNAFSEFWDMVDHPEWAFSIPGSWEDDTIFETIRP